MTSSRAGLAALMVLCGCATMGGAKLVPEAEGEFKATGSIQRGNLGASFNSARVLSPNINLARHTDDSWSGQFALSGSGEQTGLDLAVTDDAIRGVGFVLVRKVDPKGKTVLDGAFKGKTFHFEVSEEAVVIHTTRQEGVYGSRKLEGTTATYGAEGALVLTGDAAALPMRWPQMGLALVAAFY